MRRVYDDTQYSAIALEIRQALLCLDPRKVSEYYYGMNRARVSKIRDHIARELGIKYGHNEHAHGIGNNNALEIIVADPCSDEEQICGLLHLTDDMVGGVICWVSDIDNERKTQSITIRGRV